MKLYLHNFLQDNTQGKIYYPLRIANAVVQEVVVEFNEDMMRNFVKRIDFQALKLVCDDLKIELEIPEDIENIELEQAKKLHHILFEIEIVSGELHSLSGRIFPIIEGIPDMCPHVEPIKKSEEEENNE